MEYQDHAHGREQEREIALEKRLASLEAIVHETDRRHQEGMASQAKLVDAALAAAKEAVVKAEVATEKRFEGVNEFRSSLSDLTATMMSRTEANARTDALSARIEQVQSTAQTARQQMNDALTNKIDQTERTLTASIASLQKWADQTLGSAAGSKNQWMYLAAGLGLIATMLGILSTVVLLSEKIPR